MRASGLLLICALAAVADPPAPESLLERDRSARRAWLEEPVALEGRVLREDGAPAAARILAGDLEVETDGDGGFRFPKLPRINLLLTIRAHGFFDEVRPVHLACGLDTTCVRLDTLRLRARLPGRTRLVFGGDVMMARRFFLPGPGREPLLRTKTLAPDAARILCDVAPLLRAADVTVVNLESSISTAGGTAVSTKPYNFWSPPELLDALRRAGVDCVTLGNNHVWDYGEPGFQRTRTELDERGMAWCGAGIDEEGARAPAVLGPFRLLSYSGIRGTDVPLQAGRKRGGAAAMTPEAIREDTARAAAAGRVIVALHSGKEYTDLPTPRLRAAASAAAASGALMVVCHHAHTPQGLALEDGVLIAWCLANLVFDQDRWEALPGILLVVDTGPEGLEAARLFPIVNDGLVPRPATGDLARGILRRIASLSPGVPLHTRAGAAEIGFAGMEEWRRTEALEVPAGVPVKAHAADPEGWIREVSGPPGATVEIGSNLLRSGGFENEVVGHPGLPSVWTAGNAARLSFDDPRTGGACLLLSSAGATAALAHRIPVPERFTLFGYLRPEPRGQLRVRCSFRASSASGPAFEDEIRDVPADGPSWTSFSLEFRRPPGARTVTLEFSVPGSEPAALFLDDLAILEWSPAAGPLPARHTGEFLRSSLAGTLEVEWSGGIR